MSVKEQIEQLVRRQEKAVQQKNVDEAMAHYSVDIVSCDVVNTLQKNGKDACRDRLLSWLSQFPQEFSYNVENLSVMTTDELAVCYSFNHVKGKLVDGNEIDMRWRSTVCYGKTGSEWLIAHEHSSVPFDPENGKALINLEE